MTGSFKAPTIDTLQRLAKERGFMVKPEGPEGVVIRKGTNTSFDWFLLESTPSGFICSAGVGFTVLNETLRKLQPEPDTPRGKKRGLNHDFPFSYVHFGQPASGGMATFMYDREARISLGPIEMIELICSDLLPALSPLHQLDVSIEVVQTAMEHGLVHGLTAYFHLIALMELKRESDAASWATRYQLAFKDGVYENHFSQFLENLGRHYAARP